MANSAEKSQQKDSTLTCEICIRPILEAKKFKNKGKCSHPFCVKCIEKYVQVKIEDKTAGVGVICPDLNCKKRLDPFDLREIMSEKVFVECCDLMCERSIPWRNSSYCPNKKCMEITVNECGGVIKKSKCPNCKELFCFQCKRKWNEIYRHDTCRQRGKIGDMYDVLFLRLIKTKKWVQCPGCGHCIERREGCNIVICSRCATIFCCRCGRKICRCNEEQEFPCSYILLFLLLCAILSIAECVLIYLNERNLAR